jgi:hypothetical protein
MSDNGKTDSHEKPEEKTGIFKSSGISTHKLDPHSNSAVSNHAVQHDDELLVPNKVFVGFNPDGGINKVHVGSSDEPVRGDAEQLEDEPLPEPPKTKMEELEESVAKVGEMMEAVEAQRAAVEAKFMEAEQMLQQVTKVKEFLTVDDRLRDRIRATVARTAGLRKGLPGSDSGHEE